MFTPDAVVIGAGVIGSSIALELSRQHLKVLVIDKAGGIGLGSTSASSAIVRFNYSTRSGVCAAWESFHCWANWDDHLGHRDPVGHASYVKTGLLIIHPGDAGSDRVLPLFDDAGVVYEEWNSCDMAQRVPSMDTGAYWPPKPVHSDAFFADSTGTVSGIFMPDAGYVDDPQLAAQNLATAAQSLGARYLLRTEVVEIVDGGDTLPWVLTLADGESIESPIVINAAGPWSGTINRMAGIGDDFTVSTRPMRQEVHHVPAPAGYSAGAPGVSIADLDLGTYVRAAGEGLLIGGTEPECDPLEWVPDPDAANPNPTVERFEAQVSRAARRFPDLRVPNRPKGVAGVYDVTPDWTPIYDKTASAGFYVAIGTSGNQFKNAPVVGQLMAHLVAAVENGHPHDTDPVHFRAPRTGNTVDLSTFSRLRPVDADAPGSVMG